MGRFAYCPSMAGALMLKASTTSCPRRPDHVSLDSEQVLKAVAALCLGSSRCPAGKIFKQKLHFKLAVNASPNISSERLPCMDARAVAPHCSNASRASLCSLQVQVSISAAHNLVSLKGRATSAEVYEASLCMTNSDGTTGVATRPPDDMSIVELDCSSTRPLQAVKAGLICAEAATSLIQASIHRAQA